MNLIVHAPNVHQGGGAVLLRSLLVAAQEVSVLRAIVDARFLLPSEIDERRIDLRVAPTIIGRLAAERRLAQLADAESTVLCFGNLPPLFSVRANIQLFIQNRYLTGALETTGFPFTQRLRISVERMWLRKRVGAVQSIIVQTSSMAREVHRAFGANVRVLPFAPLEDCASEITTRTSDSNSYAYDFLYVASGEPHKNHERLLDAWRLLATDGIRPSLCLTLDPVRFPVLVARIADLVASEGLRLINIGSSPQINMDDQYKRARALIYPSLAESFGLPLLEARSHGLPVVAAELDYVRDVVEPTETFDPLSPVSIARAVRRFFGAASTKPVILTPRQFLDAIVSG